MNMHTHIAVLSFTLLIIILVSSISVSIASYTPTITIPSSGMVKEKVTVRKHLVVYPYTIDDATAAFIASHFDLVDFDFGATIGFEKIKALNPDVIMVGYRDIMMMDSYLADWAEVNLHEDWFLHDVNGNRLILKDYGCYAMDVGNSGWRSHYANFVKAKLDAYPIADGIFADDVWEWEDYSNDAWTVNRSLVPREIQQRWHNDMIGMIQYVKSVIGSKLLILNTDDWTGDYLKYADGMMLEGFVHASWWELDYFGWAGFNPLSHVDILADLSATGKYFLAQSGAASPTDPDKAHKMMLYCLGSFMLGVNGPKASFGWLFYHNALDGSGCYYPEMDTDIGAPQGKYYIKDGLYARDFEHGWVLVNFSTNTLSTVMEGTTYILEPHSAVIVEK